MKKVRFVMIGGFLGAGKTTTIGKLARQLVDRGEKVGLVTNDQAYNLVDTQNLRSQGFEVGEVPGACFCCKFDDLVETAGQLEEQGAPDWIIAEPVGSCTDLIATVVMPLQQLYGERFEMGPLIVLLKPEHGAKILGVSESRGFSPKAEYIFLKQLEEADHIVVNKADKLDAGQRQQLREAIEKRFPQPVEFISARDGVGLERILELAEQACPQRERMMEVDYQLYAEGEAELGWFNCQVAARSESPFELDQLVLALVSELAERLAAAEAEAAHLKILGQTLTESSIANLVDSASGAELSLASEIETTSADLLVNARVATSPEILEQIVVEGCRALAERTSIALELNSVQCFSPAPPTPTHRAS